jgi:pimeloyl-ACP methyl ester carboxylesterase
MPTFSHLNSLVHYTDSGEGIPLVFQHGLGSDINQPAEVANDLPGVRFLSFDARGHGKSELGDSQLLGFSTLASDLVALLDTLNLDDAVVGGISMGAGIALRTAISHSRRVKGLILARPAWLDQPNPANLRVLVEIGKIIQSNGARKGKNLFIQSELYAKLRSTAPAVAESALGQFDEPRAEECALRLLRIPQDVPNLNRAEWASIHKPTMVIGNRMDPIHPFEYAEALADAIPHAVLVEITPKSVDKARHLQELRENILTFTQKIIGG